ncbi:MAG: endo-1,4-beta-xylanase [Pirellulaceae bacterium]
MLAKTHFNFWTPENCMKPAPIHPQEDEWRFERADALVDWCNENTIPIHGHTLVWHAQTNDWFWKDGDKERTIERMKQHIHTLVGRTRERSTVGTLSMRRSTIEATNNGEPSQVWVVKHNRPGVHLSGIQVRA